MTLDQAAVFAVLAAALALFARGVWRYDVVALLALLVATVLGLVPPQRAFLGFGQPAVATVAAVLVIGRGLRNCGVVDIVSRQIGGMGGGRVARIATLTAVTAVASAFMNNVGAVALLMPVALKLGKEGEPPPSTVLMPLAFASLLGGLSTLIGTPPNLIVSAYREAHRGSPFGLFDFTPVGGVAALAGVLFLAFLGWRLVPRRRGTERGEWVSIESYMTELRVPEEAKVVGEPLSTLDGMDVAVAGIVRAGRRVVGPGPDEVLRAGDSLLAEVDPDGLDEILRATGLELAGEDSCRVATEDLDLVEVVVKPDSPIVGESAGSLRLRRRHGVSLLAVAREGAPLHRLKDQRFRVGDVLLLQAPADAVASALLSLGCLPLAERGLRVGSPRKLVVGVSLFVGAIAATALRLLPPHVALAVAALATVLFRLVSVREAYDAIDLPVLILIGAMFPVGEALEATGGAQLVADGVLAVSRHLPAWAALAAVLVATMCLSDIVNNAAAAVIMAPIAIAVAAGSGASSDPFLMSVAIGGSCAFLTPIGHQSNLLVMGPGGYRFGDYWRVGLPLELLIVAVSIPLLLLFWPL